MRISFEESIDSTNLYLYAAATRGEITDDVALAAFEQTGGKGRRGRTFFSPSKTGIYLSLLLHPDATVRETTLITTMMASAASRALEMNDSPRIQIKWVNDLYVGERKVGGILTECSSLITDGKPEFAVVGIGINLFPPDDGFPDEIEQRAGVVFQNPVPSRINKSFRRKIVRDIVDCFMEMYTAFPQKDYLSDYRDRLFIIGRQVQIVDGPVVTVCGLDDDFRLIVRLPDGSTDNLDAGEVSLII